MLSLKGRALKLLSAREHSRLELTRKLQRHTDDAGEIERVLDELDAKGWLSAERFIESVVHRKAERFGTQRIRQELRQHGLPEEAVAAATQDLRANEAQRAHALWLRRFGSTAEKPEDRVRQARFLIQRGFHPAIVHRIVQGRHAGEDPWPATDIEPEAPDT